MHQKKWDGAHFKWFQMSKNVSVNEIIPKKVVYKNLETDVKIKASVSNGLNGTTNSDIPVRIKRFSYIGPENKAILCNRVVFFSAKDEKNFQFWVEMTKLQGYEKIVIFNNSIPNTPIFRQVFSTHKNFVQVVQYQCLPNLFKDGNDGLPKFIDLIYNKYLHDFFEKVTQNECYWENKDKYRNIAVMDQDESVIPQILDKSEILNVMGGLNQTNNSESLSAGRISMKKLIAAETKCVKTSNDLPTYLKNLQNGFSTEKKFEILYKDFVSYNQIDANRTNPVMSYHFHMAFYPSYELIEAILDKTAKYIFLATEATSTSRTEPSILRVPIYHLQDGDLKEPELQLTIVISNDVEMAYARHLIELWTSVIKPFVGANKNAFDNLSFSRLFMFASIVTPNVCGNFIRFLFFNTI